jgi:hypothetical protein
MICSHLPAALGDNLVVNGNRAVDHAHQVDVDAALSRVQCGGVVSDDESCISRHC